MRIWLLKENPFDSCAFFGNETFFFGNWDRTFVHHVLWYCLAQSDSVWGQLVITAKSWSRLRKWFHGLRLHEGCVLPLGEENNRDEPKRNQSHPFRFVQDDEQNVLLVCTRENQKIASCNTRQNLNNWSRINNTFWWYARGGPRANDCAWQIDEQPRVNYCARRTNRFVGLVWNKIAPKHSFLWKLLREAVPTNCMKKQNVLPLQISLVTNVSIVFLHKRCLDCWSASISGNPSL